MIIQSHKSSCKEIIQYGVSVVTLKMMQQLTLEILKFVATFFKDWLLATLMSCLWFLQSSLRPFGLLNRSGGDLGPDCN